MEHWQAFQERGSQLLHDPRYLHVWKRLGQRHADGYGIDDVADCAQFHERHALHSLQTQSFTLHDDLIGARVPLAEMLGRG